jgi:chromosome segregation ATPase
VAVPVVVPVPDVAPAPVVLAAAEPEDDGSPVLDQLDRLLDRLVSERVRTADELSGYRRQLDELAAEKARLEESVRSIDERVRSTEESVRSLEAKLGHDDDLLDSMRTKLAGLSPADQV